MRVVRPPVGTRLAAVVEVPRGPLRVDPGREPPIRLSLIVPTYNESRNLEELLRQLTAVLEPRLSGEYEIVVVDDDSPDGTWAVAMRLAERWPAVRVMRRRSEKGLSTAVIRGWQVARGDVLARETKAPPDLAWAIREAAVILVQLFAPMMPHLAEESWQVMGEGGLVSEVSWPQIERDLLVEDIP